MCFLKELSAHRLTGSLLVRATFMNEQLLKLFYIFSKSLETKAKNLPGEVASSKKKRSSTPAQFYSLCSIQSLESLYMHQLSLTLVHAKELQK